jgi:hypothetical protein
MISSLSFIPPTTLLSTSNETVPTLNQTVQNSSNNINKNTLTQLRNTTNNTTSPLMLQQQAPKPVPPSSSNNTYTNSTDGISFSVPQGWTIEEGQNQANASLLTVVTVSPPIALDPSAFMQVTIEKYTNPVTSSIDQYLRDQLNSYRNIPSNNLRRESLCTTERYQTVEPQRPTFLFNKYYDLCQT